MIVWKPLSVDIESFPYRTRASLISVHPLAGQPGKVSRLAVSSRGRFSSSGGVFWLRLPIALSEFFGETLYSVRVGAVSLPLPHT